jgi:hypothetical protein
MEQLRAQYVMDGNDSHYVITDQHANFYAKTHSSVDAKLICAAPDLLQACKDALTYMGYSTSPRGVQVIDQLATAIDKAEGR